MAENQQDFRVKNGLIVGTNANIQGAITSVDSIQLDTAFAYAAPAKAQVVWNEEEGSIDFGLGNNVVVNLPEETLYRVENKSGSPISIGTLVVASGTVGSSGKILISPWNPTIHTPIQILGLTTEPIANDGAGHVTHFGKIRGIQTNGGNYGETWNNFDIIYAGPSGGLTKVPPTAPSTKTIIALVIDAKATNGTLFIRPTLSSSIANDDLVQLIGTLANGDLLVYNSTTFRFENSKNASITGNAATATTLQTTRSINGTNFNGSADITTANWGTSRTITIGSTGKSVYGSGDVSWTLSEVGAVAKAGDTMTGYLTLHANPTQSLHAVTKQYVDEVATGISTKPQVEVATTTNLSANYSNGTLGVGATLTSTTNGAFPEIDGVTLTSTTFGQNGVLVKNQTNKAHNGRYNLTQVGDGSNPWVLTRCGLCDQSNEIAGSYVFVKAGSAQNGTGWVFTVANPSTFTIGTDDITVLQFTAGTAYVAGSGIVIDGSTISHADTSSVANLSSDNSNQTFIQDISFNFDTFGHVTSATVGTATVTAPGDGTLSVGSKTAGTTNTDVTLNLSGAYSANTSTNRTINAVVGPAITNLASVMTGAGTGFIRKNGEDAYVVDSNTYLTANQSITLSGDVTGTGSTAITTTLSNTGVTSGTYTKVTVDAKGRVTAGASLALADLPPAYTRVTVSDASYNVTSLLGTVIILCNTQSNNVTINLPTAVGNTAIYEIKKINSANSMIIDGLDSETIEGDATITIVVQNESLTLVSDGSNWRVI